MKKLISFLVSMAIALSVFPTISFAATSGTCGDNLTWALSDDGTLTISGTGRMSDYEGTSKAPWSQKNTKAVVISDGVTSIGDWAFYNCYNLKSVTIPESVISIGDWAFFACDSLLVIEVNETNKYYSSGDSGVLYNKSKTVLIQYPLGKKETSFIIPESVTSIGEYAFSGCDALTSVTIPGSVTSIGKYAFNWCDGLTSVTIPDSVTSIGEYAFCRCESLMSVTIGNSVTSIERHAFSGCCSLTSIKIPENVTSIGVNAFSYCDKLISIEVNEKNKYYTSGDLGVLYNKSKTILVKYPEGNKEASFIIPDSVTSIGEYAFSSCSNLTSVTVPDSITSIGDNAFNDCWSLTSVTIPGSVTSIGYRAFGDCYNLTSVTIPDSVTSIGYYAFYGCSSLTSVTIGDSVTSIGEYAFSSCSNLTSVTIPGSVTSIGDSAFSPAVIIYGYPGTAAQEYATNNGNTFVELTYVTGVTLDRETAVMAPQETLALTATVVPSDATDKTVSWTSSNTGVATVSNGVVTAVGAGETTITATTTDGGHTATCTVTVEEEIEENAPCVSVAGVSGRAGNTVDVKINVTNNPGVVFAKFNVTFGEELTLTNVVDGGLLGNANHSNNKVSPYILYWNNGTATSDFTANGTIVTLTFEIAENTKDGIYPVTIEEVYSSTFNFEDETVYFAVKNGNVTVVSKIIGDVNGDGEITARDERDLSRHIAGWTGYEEVDVFTADVNCDGEITARDERDLSRHIAGWTGYETLPKSN